MAADLGQATLPMRVSLLARVLLVVFAVALTLGALELALRVIGYERDMIRIQVADAADARAYHVFEDDNFEYDPQLIWRPRPGQSIFNRQGFRGPELARQKPAGEFRIFAVGDSNTLGWAGEDGANWPADLHARMAGVRDDVVVVNAGVWGYASYQGLVRFRQTLEFDPDLVLVSFGSNDAHRVLESDRAYAEHPVRTSDFGRIVRRLRLGQLLISALEGPGSGEAPQLQPRVSLDEYRANLVRIIDDGRAQGVRIVLLTRPYIGEVISPYWWKNWGPDYAAATVEVGRQHGIAVIDVFSFFKGRDDLFADESHFTDEGHRQAADLIFDSVRPLIGPGQ